MCVCVCVVFVYECMCVHMPLAQTMNSDTVEQNDLTRPCGRAPAKSGICKLTDVATHAPHKSMTEKRIIIHTLYFSRFNPLPTLPSPPLPALPPHPPPRSTLVTLFPFDSLWPAAAECARSHTCTNVRIRKYHQEEKERKKMSPVTSKRKCPGRNSIC